MENQAIKVFKKTSCFCKLANSDSPISHVVKEAVNQSTKNGLLLGSLPPTAIMILEVYLAGGTAQQASKQCPCSKQNVSGIVRGYQA